MLVPALDVVQLFLQLVDVFLLRHLHLSEDLFLGVEFTVQVFSLGHGLVDLVLEFEVLLLKDLNLSVRRVQLYFRVFEGQKLIFQLRARCKQLRICVRVVFLLVLVPRNPKFPRLLLVGYDFVQRFYRLPSHKNQEEMESFLFA